MKRIDKLVLDAFLGPFLITFLVVVFILLNINMLKYFDDIIGKGLDGWTLGQLFFYFAVFTIPTALPLAVLLSSLISFGNLGEHFELTAIKAAGVSLLRALQPIFVFVILLTGAAFYANNYLVPKAALEAYSLLYDIKHKKPALDLREGSFYNGIDNISIKVDKKYPDGITLKNVIVYDHRKNDGNKEVTVADSGKMYTILNDRYLKFELFRGYNYTEGASNERAMAGQRRNTEALSRSKFNKSQVIFDLSSFELQRTDKQWFQGNRQMRDMHELQGDLDSLRKEILSQRLSQYMFRPTIFNYYLKDDSVRLPPELKAYQHERDSAERARFAHHALVKEQNMAPPVMASKADSAKKADTASRDTAGGKADSLAKIDTTRKSGMLSAKPSAQSRFHPPVVVKKTEAKPKKLELADIEKSKQQATLRARQQATLHARHGVVTAPKKPVVVPAKPKPMTDSMFTAKVDSLFNRVPDAGLYQGAGNAARHISGQLSNTNDAIENFETEYRAVSIQWHKIIASSFACIAMFLIGAPLGAIIKRGGLGVPFLVSILFFIVYYVVTMQGEKLSKQGSIGIIAGVWMADAILFVIGLFFLKQARADARLFEADFYSVAFDKLKRWLKSRKGAPVVATK